MAGVDIGLIIYFALWYLGNYYYNLQNKEAANATGAYYTIAFGDACKAKPAKFGCSGSDFAMTIATAQLAIGTIWGIFLWVYPEGRPQPKITLDDFIKMIPSGVCSAGAHAASVFSLAAGGVAFGQIVKAAEPAFSAIIGTVVYNKKISTAKWLCLIPVIGGVCMAALKFDKNGKLELDFTWGGLIGAVVANVFASFKGLEGAKMLSDPTLKGRVGGAGNQFALMTIISLLTSIPLMIFREGELIMKFWTAFIGGAAIVPTNGLSKVALAEAIAANTKAEAFNKISKKIYENLVLSGLTFYGYNELSTMTLTKVSAVTNSVANTAKRVVVIVGCAIAFNEDFSGLKPYGCAICMIGVGLYAVIDDIVKSKDKKH